MNTSFDDCNPHKTDTHTHKNILLQNDIPTHHSLWYMYSRLTTVQKLSLKDCINPTLKPLVLCARCLIPQKEWQTYITHERCWLLSHERCHCWLTELSGPTLKPGWGEYRQNQPRSCSQSQTAGAPLSIKLPFSRWKLSLAKTKHAAKLGGAPRPAPHRGASLVCSQTLSVCG